MKTDHTILPSNMGCAECERLARIFKALIHEHGELYGQKRQAEKLNDPAELRRIETALTASSEFIETIRKELLEHEKTHQATPK